MIDRRTVRLTRLWTIGHLLRSQYRQGQLRGRDASLSRRGRPGVKVLTLNAYIRSLEVTLRYDNRCAHHVYQRTWG